MSEEEKIKGTAGQEVRKIACKKEKYILKEKKSQSKKKQVSQTGQESKMLQR